MAKYIAVSLDDEKAKDIAEVISNKTAKKILNILSEKDLSESDIASSLNLPLNTIEYNLKKLEKAGLIEKAKQFFWSTRGKKIPTYKLANKSILISTKQKIKGILPAAVFSFIAAIGIRFYFSSQQITNQIMKAEEFAGEAATAGAVERAPEVIQTLSTQPLELLWLFFLAGALTALLIFLMLNWRKKH